MATSASVATPTSTPVSGITEAELASKSHKELITMVVELHHDSTLMQQSIQTMKTMAEVQAQKHQNMETMITEMSAMLKMLVSADKLQKDESQQAEDIDVQSYGKRRCNVDDPNKQQQSQPSLAVQARLCQEESGRDKRQDTKQSPIKAKKPKEGSDPLQDGSDSKMNEVSHKARSIIIKASTVDKLRMDEEQDDEPPSSEQQGQDMDLKRVRVGIQTTIWIFGISSDDWSNAIARRQI